MLDQKRNEWEETARLKARLAKESAREELGERAVEALSETDAYKKRKRANMAKAFGAGVVAGAVLRTLARR